MSFTSPKQPHSPKMALPPGTSAVVSVARTPGHGYRLFYGESKESAPIPRRDIAQLLHSLAETLEQEADALDYLSERDSEP